MITGDDIGHLVRYYNNGWHVGSLVAIEKQKNRLIAVVQTPIVGQRKKRVPVDDCERYTETVQKPEALPTKRGN